MSSPGRGGGSAAAAESGKRKAGTGKAGRGAQRKRKATTAVALSAEGPKLAVAYLAFWAMSRVAASWAPGADPPDPPAAGPRGSTARAPRARGGSARAAVRWAPSAARAGCQSEERNETNW